METSKAEHLAWCRTRALEFLDQDPPDVENAFASLASDLRKHPVTASNPAAKRGLTAVLREDITDARSMRRFIEEVTAPARFPPESDYLAWRILPDERFAALAPLLLGSVRLIVAKDATALHYDDVWQYSNLVAGLIGLEQWDGAGEPAGWYRHPKTGRRRPDADPQKEYVYQ